MNRAEREANPEDSFDSGYHIAAQQKHAERVAKTSDRVAYAIKQLESHGIEYVLKNPTTGHFHCRRKSDDQLIQFYAGTGKIMGVNDKRGIHALISMLDDIQKR